MLRRTNFDNEVAARDKVVFGSGNKPVEDGVASETPFQGGMRFVSTDADR